MTFEAWIAEPVNWVYLALGVAVLVSGFRVVTSANVVHAALYLVGAVLLGARFIQYGWALHREYSDALARRTFRYSIWYLAALFGVMLLDHYLPIPI